MLSHLLLFIYLDESMHLCMIISLLFNAQPILTEDKGKLLEQL